MAEPIEISFGGQADSCGLKGPIFRWSLDPLMAGSILSVDSNQTVESKTKNV